MPRNQQPHPLSCLLPSLLLLLSLSLSLSLYSYITLFVLFAPISFSLSIFFEPISKNPLRSLSTLRFVSLFDPSMASVTGSSLTSFSCLFKQNQAPTRISSPNSVSLSIKGKGFTSLRSHPVPHRFRVSCAAKVETVDKVCEIVRKQLALPAETAVTGDSKFTTLGADSLDTVEIVMGLEEEFGISVEEESAQSITTVQDAADLIEKLIEKKGA